MEDSSDLFDSELSELDKFTELYHNMTDDEFKTLNRFYINCMMQTAENENFHSLNRDIKERMYRCGMEKRPSRIHLVQK